MGMDYGYGFIVEVLRGVPVDDPYAHGGTSSDRPVDWTAPTTVARYERRPVALESSIEVVTVEAPLTVDQVLTAYLPYSADVREFDRVKIVDGPYAGTYEVDGKPAYWLNPYNGDTPGCVVRLGKRTGGG